MAYDVTIARLPLQALFDLKGEAAAVQKWCGQVLPPPPERPNSFTVRAGRMLQWIGPDHWILRAEIGDEAALLAALRPDAAPSDVSVVLISDTLAFFAITGPDADHVMAVATPLDLRTLAEDSVTATEAFQIKAYARRAPGGYELAFDCSYAAMIGEYLDRVTS